MVEPGLDDGRGWGRDHRGRGRVIDCAYLAGALLLGLLGNVLVGEWWLDPVVGLLIAAVAVKEGREARRGEGCCVADCCL